MADRLRIYQLFRKIHLYSALVVMVFLLMYFVTGFLIVRHDWFDKNQTEPLKKEMKLSLPTTVNTEETARYIRDQLDIRGKRSWLEKKENGEIFIEYERPGVSYRVNVLPKDNKVIVEITEHSLYQIITVFHRMHQYGGGWKYDLFMFMMDLSSISLILFSVTGFYLWLKLLKNKFWGLMFFILGIIYTSWVVWTFSVW